MERHDPFAALLEVLDERARKFGPDTTAVMGYYYFDVNTQQYVVQLDTGQIIPNPVVAGGI